MRPMTFFVPIVLLAANLAHAQLDEPIQDFGMTAQLFLSSPLDEVRAATALSIEDVTKGDVETLLSRIRKLEKLETLKFYSGDLSTLDANDPIPSKVKAVLIGGCKISQGTLRWLAKLTSGTEIVFGGCNARSLDFDLGKFKWVTFDNCALSRSAIVKLVQRLTQVTFKECTLKEE
jgi:adenylosuccinate synthase